MRTRDIPAIVNAKMMIVLALLIIAAFAIPQRNSLAATNVFQELLLTEIVVTPTGGEFVEIYNPNGSAVDLSNVYLTDATFAGGSTYYYNIVTGSNAGGGGFADFHARFPDGASIGAGEYQTIAMTGSDAYFAEYGSNPDYELFEDSGSADAIPDMREATSGSINDQGGLTNGGEFIVIYYWDGTTDLVADLDYVVWGDKAEAVDKTGIAIDGPDADSDTTTYADDTAIGSQAVVSLGAHAAGQSYQRIDLTEGAEVKSGGNGGTGHDETSEDTNNTWCIDDPTPKAMTECEPIEPPPPPPTAEGVRIATYNASLNRFNEGDLINDLSTPNNAQAQAVAEIIQLNAPDVLLINEFDYDADGTAADLFRTNYLEVSQNGAISITYPYVYSAPSNTGIPSGFDLDNDGNVGGGNDAFGFGFFEGQYGMVLYSKYPIEMDGIRTFQEFLWKDMPNAMLPADPNDADGNGDFDNWYTAEELEVVRLSSKSHWDVPITVEGTTIHILASHPTPPVFDGPEDRNGTRNFDEIRFWVDYIAGESYMYDDNGMMGGLPSDARFVLLGDQNSDPNDGDSIVGAANQLTDNPAFNHSVVPDSLGGPEAATNDGGVNLTHTGDPAYDTADFSEPPGNLRVDYALPSADLVIENAGVFWPVAANPNAALIGASDHRMVYVDLDLPPITRIHDIQGDGASSPVENSVAVIEGIVVGDFQDDVGTQGDVNGFYVQEEDSDADDNPATSEGIFVFDGSDPAIDVAIGDRVVVSGTVTEFFGETEISADIVTVVSSNHPLPTAAEIAMPLAGAIINADDELKGDLEAYEGMRVTFPMTLTVVEMFNLDRFGEIGLSSDGRLYQYTQRNAPDQTGFNNHLEYVATNFLMLDDGLTVQNPDPIRYPDGELDSADVLRMGDTITDLTGVVRYARGSGGSGDETYRIMPTEDPVFVQQNTRPASPPDVGGSLTVASFNVLNFFTTIDVGNPICGPNGDQDCRGADSQAEYDRQLEKMVVALQQLDADIIGLMELENSADANPAGDGNDPVLEALVDALNAAAGAGTYAFVDSGTVGTDAIRTAFIYKPANVSIPADTTVETLDDSDLAALGLGSYAPLFDGTSTNRTPLAATFEEVATGERVTVVVNHFKSKGSSGLEATLTCSNSPQDDLNCDQGDGQGYWNLRRTQAAEALSAWLETDPTNSGDTDKLVIGDINAYAMEDPIGQFNSDGYTDLELLFGGDEVYSYVFDGQIGTLDYGLASETLLDQVTGTAAWYINADEADALDYNLDFGRPPAIFDGDIPFRASDHDPLLIGLDLESEVTLTLLHNNDGESALLPTVNESNGTEIFVGGVDAFESVVEREIDDANNSGNAILNVYAGDSFLASAVLALTLPPENGPFYDAIAQRQIPYTAHVIGNHEFDYEPDFLEQFIRAFDSGSGLDQPFLSANLDFSAEAGFADLIDADGLIDGAVADDRPIARSMIYTDPATGAVFGIVGATTFELENISSPGDVGVTDNLEDTAAAVQDEIDRLEGMGVNKIILVSHMQAVDTDKAMLALLSGVDLAVGGGGDEILVNNNSGVPVDEQLLPGEDAPVGDYPTEVLDADGETVYLVTAKGQYKYVGRLDVTFDDNGEVTGVVNEESYPRRVIPDTNDAGDLAALGVNDAVTPDATLVATVSEPVQDGVDAFANDIIANLEVTLQASRPEVRGQESNLGNLIADSFIWTYRAYDSNIANPVVAVQNGGGIRQNAGDAINDPLTREDTLNILPFANQVAVLHDVTPTDFKAIMEQSIADPLPDGGFLQIGGFRVTYDTAQPVGSRVLSITLDDQVRATTPIVENGAVVAGAPNVDVVTNNFTAGGGDGYAVLESYTAEILPFTYEGALIKYLQEDTASFPVLDLGNGAEPTVTDDDPRYQPNGNRRMTFAAPVNLTLLHNNDGESALLTTENTVGDDDVTVGGVAAFKSVVVRESDAATNAGNAVLNVYAGDSFLASSVLACTLPPANGPFYDAIAQRQIDYTAHVFGNHEFDYSPSFLEQFVRAFNGEEPFLSANLDFTGETSFADLLDADGLIDGMVMDDRPIARSMVYTDPTTGAVFGIVGATTFELENISSPGDVIVTDNLADTAAAVQAEIDRLEGMAVNKIILVSHMQSVNTDKEMIALLSGVDIAVGGGGDEILVNNSGAVPVEDQLLPGEDDPVGDYPTEVMDADSNTVYLVTAKGQYKYVGRLDVTFDAAGNVTAVDNNESYPRRVVPDTNDAALLAQLGVDDAVTPDQGLIDTVVTPVETCLADFSNDIIANLEVTLDAARTSVRAEESNLGNLIADSFIWTYESFDSNITNPVVAVQNGGGIRQNAGDEINDPLTREDTLNILPFANQVAVMRDVTPADFKAAMEVAIGDPLPDGGFLQIGGFRVLYDIDEPIGSRVISITVDTDVRVQTPIVANGAVVAGAPNVDIVTNNFTAGGGDGYDVFAGYDAEILPFTYEQALIKYLEEDTSSFPMEDQGNGMQPTVQDSDPRYQRGGNDRIVKQFGPPTDVALSGISGQAETPTLMLSLVLVIVAGLGVMVLRRRTQ